MTIKQLLCLYVIWQLAVFVVSSLAPMWLPLRPGFVAGPPPLASRLNFDGLNYQSIANHGYQGGLTAFFPLYPLVSKYIHPLIVSNLFFLAFLLVFNKLLLLDYTSYQVRWIIIAWLTFPTSFFLSMGYSESLFLFLVISCFYLYRTGRLLPAVAVGALATSARFVGIFLVPSVFLIKKSHLILLIPLGLLLYMAYLQVTIHDPLAFIHSLSTYGEFRSTGIVLFPQVYWRYFKMFVTISHFDYVYVISFFELVISILFLVLSLLCFKKLSLSYALFNFCVFVIPTLTGSFVSLPRYVLACFPSFILIGLWVSKPKQGAASMRLVPLGYHFASILLFILFLSLFTQGYWVS